MKLGKKLLAMLMTLVMLLGTVGVASAEEMAIPEGRTVVEFWNYTMTDYVTNWWKKWVDTYNNSQDEVWVNLVFVPEAGWNEKLKAAQATGTAPDIYSNPIKNGATSIPSGAIIPFDDYVDPAVWEQLTPAGEIYSVFYDKHWVFPWYLEPSMMLAYRKDMFEAAGLDPEAPPTTWAELIEYGQKLTTFDVWGLNMATADGDITWTTWGMQAGLNGPGMALNEDWTAANVNTEGYLKLLNFYKDLFDAGICPPQCINGYSTEDPICQGRVAMAALGSWTLGMIKLSYPEMVDKIGVSFFPTEDGDYKKATATLGGYGVMLDGNSKHPQEAADFLVWMFAGDPEVGADFIRASNYSKYSGWAPVMDLANTDEAAYDGWMELVQDKVMNYAVPEPLYPWDVSLSIGVAVNRVLLEGMDPQEALEIAEEEINKYIKDYNVPAMKQI